MAKIFAKIETADAYGYTVYDWFEGDVLDREFETAEEAEQAARAAYKGADVDGVECSPRAGNGLATAQILYRVIARLERRNEPLHPQPEKFEHRSASGWLVCHG